ncbi:MAG: heavy metal translocating P-type ATPase, partial [Anaerovoracaceae bacterium]
KSISDLMDIRPDYANRKDGDVLTKVDPEEIQIGELILVQIGEKIPLDGIVLEGTSTIDTSALTGESIPRKILPHDEILSGCINMTGVLTIKVTKPFSESTVSKILELVENASDNKSRSENFITKFAAVYTPIVVIAALLLALVPPLIFPGETFSDWTYRALTFLVVSCPCALVISVPLSFFGGIGGASKAGILIKGSNYMETLSKARTVVFDKTGTLTQGSFNVQEISPVGISKEDLLRYAAYVESYSPHPISVSLKRAFGAPIDQALVSKVEDLAGHGLSGIVEGHPVLAGNRKLMGLHGITLPEAQPEGTIVHVAVDNQYAGYILIADQIKSDGAKAIKKLREMHIQKTVMLTGDSKATGESVAEALGLDEVYTELLPGDKVQRLEQLLATKADNTSLAFVGDGINDAPVLARADIGIAMGGLGSDAAIEAADVVIMTDEPSKVSTAIAIAQRTLRIVKQNIIFALAIKSAVLILGAFGVATMWEAVFADVGVAVIAILNALRALRLPKEK